MDRGFEKVLIIPNVGKPGIDEMVATVSRWLESRGLQRLVLDTDADRLAGEHDGISVESARSLADLAVVLGGDGTVLHAVDVLWGGEVPLVGINIGKMGFLTAGEVHQAEQVLEEILAGRYYVSERIPVGCTVEGGGSTAEYRALNEVVIGKLVRERLIHLSTYINGEFFMRYSGDGLIVSSATGSTAYSLSAGGPIVTPSLVCFLLTPICAHMLFSRPIVLDSRDRVTVVVEEKPERLALSIDGREDVEVPPGASIDFHTLDWRVKILELEGSSFYQTLRRKFMGPPPDEPERGESCSPI
ncbi:MAG: NAD(+)/NADH kinase [Actinobacteria bacterium]|nr:NAD(+)/NADH kinase [Actinomycetota bacterium]MBU1942373.1 NAD(+)/NADH kinase [Actinomycetota bacterium]MBU2689275.1 NAD(+)/NADH kinase [Actinomycetota bacterium]